MTEITRDELSDNIAEHGAVMRGAIVAAAAQSNSAGIRLIRDFLSPRGFLPTDQDVFEAVAVNPADPGIALVAKEFESIRQFRADANARKAAKAPRLCKDCRHAVGSLWLAPGPDCAHPSAPISLVTGCFGGKCEAMRGPHHATEWRCGPTAVGFEAKS
jgi:hypothetical protein